MSEEITLLEKQYAEEFYQAVMDWSGNTDRAKQQTDFRIGVSDIGHCSEKVRRMLERQEPEQTPDKLAAFLGTWVGEGVEQAIKVKYPSAIIQSEISLDLETDQGGFTITGHPDIILPDKGVLWDVKTVSGLAKVTSYKLFENDLQKRFQRHAYGVAAHRMGLFGDTPIEDILVGNLWVDRGGDDHEFLPRLEPLDLSVIDEMSHWLSEVVYAYKNGVEARKEPSRSFCMNYCEFAPSCRSADTDVEGLIEDPQADLAAELYQQGIELEKQGRRLKDQAKTDLSGLSGSTGQWLIRWVEVGETVIPEQVRRGYSRLSLSRISK